MKKKLLLSFAVFATALAVNAQKRSMNSHPYYKTNRNVEIVNKHLDYKSEKVSSLKRGVNIVDTVSIAIAKAGMAQSKPGTFKLALFPTKDPKNSGGFDVLFAIQKFPMVGTMKIKGFGAELKGLRNIKTDVDYQIQTKDTTYSGFVTINGNEFKTHFFNFDKSVEVTDTFTIFLSPKTPLDSLVVLQSGDVSKLKMNSYNGLLGVLSLDKSYKEIGFNAYSVESDAQDKPLDADYQIYPVVEYAFESKAVASKQCLPKSDMSVEFDFSGNKNLLNNPIFNLNAFFINYENQDKAQKRFFATVDYTDLAMKDTIDTNSMKFKYTFNNNLEHSVSIVEVVKPWGFSNTVAYSSSSSFKLGVCASLDESTLKGLNIYPNPVANELNIKFNANSAAIIELVNVAGQVIATKNASEFADVTFNTAELNAGVYFVNIKVAEGTFTQKIIKE